MKAQTELKMIFCFGHLVIGISDLFRISIFEFRASYFSPEGQNGLGVLIEKRRG